MHDTQAGDMWTARLLVCYLHCVYATSVNISTETKHIFINEEENNWWDARKNCKMALKRDLYISDTEFLPPVMENSLHNNTSYWVGAMRYSTWIWTEDGTPLYNYDGYSASPTTSPNNVSSNSVYGCQLHCKTNRTVGLSGEKCYCLGNSYNVTKTSARWMQCPGNPDEICGDDAGMSVYTRGTGNVGFKPSKDGRCAYGVKMNNTVSIELDYYYACIDYKRRFAYYSHNTPQANCSGGVCVSSSAERQTWTHAHYSNDLIRLNDSTAREIQNIKGPTDYFWIGLVLKVSRKYVDGQEANGNEDYIFLPFVVSQISTCQALKKDGVWKPYWLPCHFRLASVCEVSRADPSHPTTDSPSALDIQKGVSIGLAAGCVVFFLVVVTLVFLLQRQRKLHLDRRDTNQQVNFNPPTENTIYDGLDVPRDNGAYSVITPDTIDGKPFTPPVPTATVNPNAHTEKFYVNHPETDVEKVSNSLSTPSKQHTDMPGGKPYMHLSGPDYDTAECILQYRSGDGRDTGLDKSAGGSGVANSDEGVQYHTFEKCSSTGGDKSDAGLYDPTEAAEGNYDTPQQGENARKVNDSYSHIGAIDKVFEEGDYDVASAGPDVIRLDDTYNHTYETTCKATDEYNT
ncbi:uncharacterized protein LOC124120054 [Haliotis rufescens]|uniref:uncharacterized protein LOC124120054 n=1 Tax=Haliotis rufescens TaxID=6454 RepID=UPI001EAFE6B0|nr:uncharacterized protein LOC124120054 [Haliotis rufescens]